MPWRRFRAACLALLLGLTLAEEKWSVPQQEHTSSIWGLIHGLRPPVVFRLKELWKREANSRTNRTVTKRSVACWLKLPESGLNKTLQRAQSLAVVRGLSARAVECARLGPSGCPPRGQGAPLRPRGSFPRLALACARATIPAAARRGVGARRCCASHRPFRHPRSLGAEKGAEALRHTRKTHKRTNR